MRNPFRPTTALLLPAALLLCGFGDPEFGATVTYNIAGAAVAMNPQHAGTPIEGGNGKRAVDAYKRYLTGTQKALLRADSGSRVGAQGGAADAATQSPN